VIRRSCQEQMDGLWFAFVAAKSDGMRIYRDEPPSPVDLSTGAVCRSVAAPLSDVARDRADPDAVTLVSIGSPPDPQVIALMDGIARFLQR